MAHSEVGSLAKERSRLQWIPCTSNCFRCFVFGLCLVCVVLTSTCGSVDRDGRCMTEGAGVSGFVLQGLDSTTSTSKYFDVNWHFDV